MNRLTRAGIAVVLLVGVLWSGGVAEAGYFISPVTVCVDASSGVVRHVASSSKCVGGTQSWSASQPAPLLCWNASSLDPQAGTRKVSVAPSSGCTAPLQLVPVDKVSLLCAGGEFGVLRWPVTGSCRSGATPIRVRSAATPTTVAITIPTTTPTTVVVVPSVSLSATTIQGNTWPKAVTVTANVAGTIYFAEGDFVVRTVSDITSAPSYRWAQGTLTSANTPTSIAIDVDAVTNGYYRVYVANSQGVLSAPATNIVTVSVTRASTATTSTTAAPLTCATGGSCTVGVDRGAGGGIVFYYSATAFTSTGSDCGTNCHYLEASPTDPATSIVVVTTAAVCYASGSTLGTSNCQTNSIYSGDSAAQSASRSAATVIGMGMSNTNHIYARLTTVGGVATTDYAAGIAWAYTNNSKTDWFLPSKNELTQLWANRSSLGDWGSGNYASSSEYDYSPSLYMWSYYSMMGSYSLGGLGKSMALYLRPVRAG
jgi:hypothetical protein